MVAWTPISKTPGSATTAPAAADILNANFTNFAAYKLELGGDTMLGPMAYKQGTLTDGATVTPIVTPGNTGGGAGNVFTWTIGGNRTLANPTGAAAGIFFRIIITQDGTGGRTLAFGSAYKHPFGMAPSLSTGSGKVDVLDCYCVSATFIITNLGKAYA